MALFIRNPQVHFTNTSYISIVTHQNVQHIDIIDLPLDKSPVVENISIFFKEETEVITKIRVRPKLIIS